jgi:hypothetical protein
MAYAFACGAKNGVPILLGLQCNAKIKVHAMCETNQPRKSHTFICTTSQYSMPNDKTPTHKQE